MILFKQKPIDMIQFDECCYYKLELFAFQCNMGKERNNRNEFESSTAF